MTEKKDVKRKVKLKKYKLKKESTNILKYIHS